MWSLGFLSLVSVVMAGPATESFKDQFCTDPRTMQKHAAYTEWADAYSCSRHRCQPGGRNLAIYSVGCKRVEAPESAIECEEVVEDTNMQFPYCCTRLRCLVVVRGEVWTRVLGQPWETLPAAPWSHMYKMKKPPPTDEHFTPKNAAAGPVYELQSAAEEKPRDKTLRTSQRATPATDCDHGPAPAPDIVIALSTATDDKDTLKNENTRHKHARKTTSKSEAADENRDHNEIDFEETPVNDKISEASEEKMYEASSVTQNISPKATWTDIPQNQWNEHEPATDFHTPRTHEEKKDKPRGLQALVDAIGNRMRDIESVVQRMSEKVHTKGNDNELTSVERHSDSETPKQSHNTVNDELDKPKKSNPNNEHYKRFSVKNRGSKYLHGSDVTSEQPLFVEDSNMNMNGYYSDASNSIRRANKPKEPAPTYVAPVENRRKSHVVPSDISSESEKKHKKHGHKKKRKNKSHKKHHGKEEKKKRFNKLTSGELDKNIVSLEDSSNL